MRSKAILVVVIIAGVLCLNPSLQAQYWRNTIPGNHAMIYQWPYDGSLGGLPETNPIHFLNYVPNPDYTYLNGPSLYNGYLTIALGQAVNDLQVTVSSFTQLNQIGINTATDHGISGADLTLDSHFMLDPLGANNPYILYNQLESLNEMSFHVYLPLSTDFFALNVTGTDPDAFTCFMQGIDYDNMTIIGDGVQFHVGAFVPEPLTITLLSAGSILILKQRRRV